MSARDKLYWTGFGRVAARHFGMVNGGAFLAALVRAEGGIVYDRAVPSGRAGDFGQGKFVSPRSAAVLASQVRQVLADLGFEGALERVKAPYGERSEGDGGYRLDPEVARQVRELVERGA